MMWRRESGVCGSQKRRTSGRNRTLFAAVRVLRAKKYLLGRKNATFQYGSLYNANLRDADVIYVFGMPETMAERLKTKLEAELKLGARVVSYTFAIEGWKPTVVNKENPTKDLSVYVYEMGRV